MVLPIRSGIKILRNHGILPLAQKTLAHYGIFNPIWNTVTSRYSFGTNIFDRDWDLLVILDACRVDTLASLADSINWIDEIDKIRSVGGMSAEWMLKTFTQQREEIIDETAFVSGNIWSHRIFNERFHEHMEHRYDMIHEGFPKWEPVSANDFAYYETVYPFSNQDLRLHPEAEHIPHVLTDRAIAVGRQEDFDRMVIHYTLPHLNHIANALDWAAGEHTLHELMTGDLAISRDLQPEEKSFEPARRGEVSAELVMGNFAANLRFAVEYVNILTQNIDATNVIISADHGEGFGERGVWGHPYGCPFPPVKTVPWASTTAIDKRTYEPQYEKIDRVPTEQELREHLQAMGYYPS